MDTPSAPFTSVYIRFGALHCHSAPTASSASDVDEIEESDEDFVGPDSEVWDSTDITKTT